MIKAIRQSISFLPLLLTVLLFPSLRASAEPVDLLVNGSFNSVDGGWLGADGQNFCEAGEPSLAPWGTDGLVFSYEYNIVYQEVVVPDAGEVVLVFSGFVGQAGGYYEAVLEDANESVSSGELINTDEEQSTLTVTTESSDEVVTVTFGGVDEAWWQDCYGPVVTGASLLVEPAPEETTTTTSLPDEYSPPTSGLDYWTYESNGGQPQLPPSGQLLSQGQVDGMTFDWGGGEVLDSGRYDGVTVKFEGWLSAPEAKTYYICAFTDDGFKLYLDETLVINDWWDRGPSCGNTADVDFADGQPKRLTAYFYENGGGAVAELRYYTDQGSWSTVPDSWYSNNGTAEPPETTTTAPANFLGSPTNVSVTQTDDGVLVDWDASTEDVGISPERYAISWSTGQSGWGIATGNTGDPNALNTSIVIPYSSFETTGGFDVTYTFTVRADNDSLGVYSQQSSGVDLAVSAPTPPTTTTEAPPVTEPEPTNPPDTTPEETTPPDTAPEETVPEETIPEETVPEETIPEETVPEETLPEETVPEETVPEETVPEETVPEETVPPVEEPALEEELAVIEDPAELEALIEEINLEEASDEELIAIISSEAFSNIDSDKIKAVIESVDFENLSDEQTAEIVNALNEADDSVKEVFEEEVNVYSGQFDAYVPSGSVITIAERRVVVAVTATTSIMGATTGAGAGRRKQK